MEPTPALPRVVCELLGTANAAVLNHSLIVCGPLFGSPTRLGREELGLPLASNPMPAGSTLLMEGVATPPERQFTIPDNSYPPSKRPTMPCCVRKNGRL